MRRNFLKGVIINLCIVFTLTASMPVLAQEISPSSEDAAMSFEEKQKAILENGVFVVNGYLLGAWDGENWLRAETAFPYIPDYMYYEIYWNDLRREVVSLSAIGHKYMHLHNPIIEGGSVDIINLESMNVLNGIDYIAARTTHLLNPYDIYKHHPSNPVYQEWTDDVVAESANPDLKLYVREVYDIGNGFELIIADNLYRKVNGLLGQIVFVRRTIDDKEKNLVLNWYTHEHGSMDAYMAEPFQLIFVCNLNNDDEAEIIIRSRGYSQFSFMSYTVYSYQDGEYKRVMSGGWTD